MKFEDLPDSIRVKLKAEAEQQLWSKISGMGGIKAFARKQSYSASKMYNWKNKVEFLPVSLVKDVLDVEVQEVTAIKGEGRSRPLENPGFPLVENDELLTRINVSVYVNNEGVPIYQADDVGLVNRFVELLNLYGNTPVEIYNRSVYEVRYPKYMQDIFDSMSFEEDFPALVDEKGGVENHRVTVNNRRVNVDEFEGQLYSRDKRLELALARGDSKEVADIIAEEAERIQNLS